MTQLQWAAKKAAYEYFRSEPKKMTKEEKLWIESWIYEMCLIYRPRLETNQPYYEGNVIYGYFAFN